MCFFYTRLFNSGEYFAVTLSLEVVVMKRFVLAGLGLLAMVAAAPAADLPRSNVLPYKAPAAVVAFNWTGLYVGIHGGYAWANSSGVDLTGGFVGGQVGYNWQAPNSPWVFGVEFDSAWADLGRSDTFVSGGTAVTASSDANYMGSFRGKVGYAWDRTMLYVTGGLGWVHNTVSITATSGSFTAGISDSRTQLGGLIGVGLEHAILPNLSAKVEYLYGAYGSETYFSGIGGGASLDADVHTLKVGLNYRIR